MSPLTGSVIAIIVGTVVAVVVVVIVTMTVIAAVYCRKQKCYYRKSQPVTVPTPAVGE